MTLRDEASIGSIADILGVYFDRYFQFKHHFQVATKQALMK